jgi:catechol 2,3-dioxygenase-like lactoylglutathione lyase family enzyme
MNITTKGFLHITISVTDLERATAFYRDVLGCTIVNQNPIMTFMKTGDDMFVLTKLENHVRPNAPGPADIDTTLFHHAFLVDDEDYATALEYFRANGIDHFDCSDHKHSTFPGRKHTYIFDPDGNSIELTTFTAEERAAALA